MYYLCLELEYNLNKDIMLQFEVGKTFPIEKCRNIGEKTLAILNENFFDTLLSIDAPSKEEILQVCIL